MNNISAPTKDASSSLVDLIDSRIFENIRNVQTDIVAEVISINRKEGLVTVLPLIKTMWERSTFFGDVEAPYPEIGNVIVKQISAGRGKAFICMPVKVGDVGVLTFSSRDTTNYLISNGEQLVNSGNINNLSMDGKAAKLCWEGELFTQSKPLPIPERDIVITNEQSNITMSPEGKITITNGQTTLVIEGGKVTGNAPSGFELNGAQVTPDGNIITATGVDLNAFKAEYDTHKHNGAHGVTSTPV